VEGIRSSLREMHHESFVQINNFATTTKKGDISFHICSFLIQPLTDFGTQGKCLTFNLQFSHEENGIVTLSNISNL
jgi:hypothetical protein